MDLPVIIGLVVAIIVAFIAWRAWTLTRSARAFEEGRRLAERGDLTPSEQERLATLQERSKSWGPEMDPTLTAVERLRRLPPDYAWLAQNVSGDEDPRYLRMFADGITAFAAIHRRGCSTEEVEEAAAEFARAVFMLEATRLQKTGASDSACDEGATAEGAKVAEHFFGDRTQRGPDGGWLVIGPPGTAATPGS